MKTDNAPSPRPNKRDTRGGTVDDAERHKKIGELCRIYQRGLAAQERITQHLYKSDRELGGLKALVSAGNAAARQLVVDNYGLIIKLVRLSCYGMPEGRVYFDDLLQYGVLGWLRGCARYDPNRGITISTFIQHWIREAVRNAYRDSSIGIGISGVHGGDLAISLRRYISSLEQEEKNNVNPQEVANLWNSATVSRCAAILSQKPEYADKSMDEIVLYAETIVRRRGQWLDAQRVLDANRRISPTDSIDMILNDNGDTLGSELSTKRSSEDEVLERIELIDRQHQIEKSIAKNLTEIQYAVVKLYFGLGDVGISMSHNEIAEVLKISTTASRKTLEAALITLREDPELQEMIGLKKQNVE